MSLYCTQHYSADIATVTFIVTIPVLNVLLQLLTKWTFPTAHFIIIIKQFAVVKPCR